MISIKIPLSKPDITESEKEKVFQVLNTPNLSLGPKLKEFEKKFAKYIGSEYAVAVNSGTSGLHLCIRALGIKDGDKVLTSPFSFIASANCILFERARPIFIDIDEKSMNIDVNRLSETIKNSKGKKIKAILPVHVFGRPCDMNEIMKLAEKYELKIIEDACEAIGAENLFIYSNLNPQYEKLQGKNFKQLDNSQNTKGAIKNEKIKKDNYIKTWRKVGALGDCGVFAFYPNKQMTTGEGGMIVTDNEKIYKLCRSMRNQGRSENEIWLQHERLGYNYRISDINCALGIAQLKRIDKILFKREKVVKLYKERLKDIEELIIPHFEEDKKISWFVYVVRLNDKYSQEDRDVILKKLKQKGIGCSNYFSPIHLQPFYKEMFGYNKGDFATTEKISERTIALPFYNDLKEEQIDYVCESLKKIIHNL